MKSILFNMALCRYFFSSLLKQSGKVHLLKPKLSLSYNGQENGINGEYFIGMEGCRGETYTLAKDYQLTESETGLSISLDLTAKFFGRLVSVSKYLLTSKIESLTYAPVSSFGMLNGS